MPTRKRTLWLLVLVAVVGAGFALAAISRGAKVLSLGELPVRINVRFVDRETNEPIQGVLLFVASSEELAADAEFRTLHLKWAADFGQEDMASEGLARSREDGSVDFLLHGRFCYRSDEPYRSRHDTDRVQPFQAVGGAWIQHPAYGEIVMSTHMGTWSGPTHHRDYDEGPWVLDMGTIELQRKR